MKWRVTRLAWTSILFFHNLSQFYSNIPNFRIHLSSSKIAKDERTRERLIEQTKQIDQEYQSISNNHAKALHSFEEASKDFTKETIRFEKRETLIKVNSVAFSYKVYI
jgi:hypothetical protein